jgi:hypothetical protein
VKRYPRKNNDGKERNEADGYFVHKTLLHGRLDCVNFFESAAVSANGIDYGTGVASSVVVGKAIPGASRKLSEAFARAPLMC